ncbi:MAG: phage holin family protein [Oscillospiraceae bacterium]|nr:phage holin family protein [Oscillospiraceae bacterium]
MIENFGLATVVTITIIAYLVGEAVKLLPFDVSKWIPVVCGFVGGCLGAMGMYVVPDYPAGDIMTAIAVGIVSGFAATGVHQVYKQVYPAEDDDAWM